MEAGPKLKASEGIAQKEVMKICGERWGSMTDKEKEPFEKMY